MFIYFIKIDNNSSAVKEKEVSYACTHLVHYLRATAAITIIQGMQQHIHIKGNAIIQSCVIISPNAKL
jgi:hypothetical protein